MVYPGCREVHPAVYPGVERCTLLYASLYAQVVYTPIYASLYAQVGYTLLYMPGTDHGVH